MLFAVISRPRPDKPSNVAADRQRYWAWITPLMENGTVRHAYPITGRGLLAILDVPSNEALHRFLNEWSEIVPAGFDIYPLIDQQASQAFLAKSGE
jgi:hypothetical protein